MNGITDATVSRASGTVVSRERLDYAQALRCVSDGALAKAARMTAAQLSRVKHGQPVKAATLRRLAAALVELPVVDGADLLLAGPSDPQAVAASGISHRRRVVK